VKKRNFFSIHEHVPSATSHLDFLDLGLWIIAGDKF